ENFRRGRRLGILWTRYPRPVSTRRRLRRPHPQGRETGRPAGAGADQVRVGDQPQNRQGARPDRAGYSARPRRRGGRMRRRQFITLIGSAAAAWPLAARAQQPAMPVVGMLSAEWPGQFTDRLRAFHEGLRETGYVDGRNLAIESRWAEGRNDRLPALTAELVRWRSNTAGRRASTTVCPHSSLILFNAK